MTVSLSSFPLHHSCFLFLFSTSVYFFFPLLLFFFSQQTRTKYIQYFEILFLLYFLFLDLYYTFYSVE